MRTVTLIALLGLATGSLAATRSAPQVYEPDREIRRPLPFPRPYQFSMEILSEGGGPRAESSQRGTPYIHVREGEAYSIRLYNPLPVRAGVNLCVDGLNTINGKPSQGSQGPFWVLDPGGSVVISGWQVDPNHARRFIFTTRGDSYAKWQDRQYGTQRARETGKITAAFFWSQAELAALQQPRWTEELADRRGAGGAPSTRAQRMEKDAGTGMGERIGHNTVSTRFHFDSGMYGPDEAVTVTYGFRQHHWNHWSDRTPRQVDGYAVEMPESR